MPRRQRIVIPEIPHHFTQGGNNRQDVFHTDADRQIFLQILANYAGRYHLDILGYCLMSNHYHLVAVPHRKDSANRALACLHADYARYFNLVRQSSGHIWRSRFLSSPMSDAHSWSALAYIERNPVRAGIVGIAEYYPWSSASARLGLVPSPPWLELAVWRRNWSQAEWRELLHVKTEDASFRDQLRAATLAGSPLGAGLAANLETIGRPKLSVKAAAAATSP